MAADIYQYPAVLNDTTNTLLIKIWWKLQGIFANGSGGGGGGGTPVTSNSSVVSAAGGNIPAGAKGWTFTILTGTATFNGAAALPAGFSDSDPGTTAAQINFTVDAASTAYVRYGS